MKIVNRRIIIAVLPLVFLLGACSKDQRKVNKIEGTWKAISYEAETASGAVVDLVKESDLSLTYDFDKCKVKSDEFCSLTVEYNYPGDPTYTFFYSYRVVANGKWLEYGNYPKTNSFFAYRIKEFNNEELVLESDAEEDIRTISFVKI